MAQLGMLMAQQPPGFIIPISSQRKSGAPSAGPSTGGSDVRRVCSVCCAVPHPRAPGRPPLILGWCRGVWEGGGQLALW